MQNVYSGDPYLAILIILIFSYAIIVLVNNLKDKD